LLWLHGEVFYHTVQDIQKAVIGLEVSQTDGVGI
jgi:hypothetical protein